MSQVIASGLGPHGQNGKPLSSEEERNVALEFSRLSAREYQLLDLACEGLSPLEIAFRIFSDEATVRLCLDGIAVRMGVVDYESLVTCARRHELFKTHSVVSLDSVFVAPGHGQRN